MGVVNRIFSLLAQSNMSQKEFALALTIPPQVITDWKSGKSKSFERRLPQIAEVLGTTVDYLSKGEIKEPATVSGGGQAEKLVKALYDIGLDVDRMSEAEISRIARLAKAALEE